MKGLGSGDNGEFTFLDYMAMFSLWLGFQNLDLNLTQRDKQDLQDSLNEKTELLLTEIHRHLEKQDQKLEAILNQLEDYDAVNKET